jgi:hypothetical protein
LNASNEPGPGPDGSAAQGSAKISSGRGPAAFWVAFVIILAALVGVVSYAVIITSYRISRFMFRGPPGSGPGVEVFASYLAFHVILSTVSIGLLLALIAVYARTYSRTHANFILGLLIVLFALLLQNLVSYPLLNPFINVAPLQLSSFGISGPIADVFTIIAYTVFLYLSLE